MPLTHAKPHFLQKVTIDGDTDTILEIKEVAEKPARSDDDGHD